MSGRFRLRALLALIAVGASLFAFARPAAASTDEDFFVNAINQIRASRGLGALSVSPQLAAVANGWSMQMASDGTLAHNPALASQVSGWRMLGENVGTGGDVASIETAFENSPHHFENMVDPSFTEIGVSVVQDPHGTLWVTEDYEQPKGAPAPAPVPAPTHTSPPAPRPVPRPAPKPAAAPHPASTPVHASAPVHAAATPAAAPVAAPVATTVAPAPSVPLAVLGASHQRTASNGPSVPNPFTAANLAGLVALVVLGSSMAMFARVRGQALRTA